MKLIKTQMVPQVKNLLHIEERVQPFLYSPYHGRPTFHSHPEIELTYIVEGQGNRIIGNNLAAYSKGDMVLLGPDVPHIWLSDPTPATRISSTSSRAIVAYMDPRIFEQMFDLLQEFESIKQTIRLASSGLYIYGDTKKRIGQKMEELSHASGYVKFEGFLNILHTIATSNEKEFISDEVAPHFDHFSFDRLPPVIQYIKENLANALSLDMLAGLTCMTVPSFCRFFRARMGMSPLQYVVEERMALARRLLMEIDKPIYDIAGRCGYKSDSHFCKIFKSHFGISPYRYKSNRIRLSNLAGV